MNGKVPKEMQSTLEGMEGQLDYHRRMGNSIRQVDNAIQILYSGKICVVRDHWEDGTHERANLHLFDMILRRLECEHYLSKLVKDKKIRIDKSRLEIELL